MNEKILTLKTSANFTLPHYMFYNHGIDPNIEVISMKIDEDSPGGDILIWLRNWGMRTAQLPVTMLEGWHEKTKIEGMSDGEYFGLWSIEDLKGLNYTEKLDSKHNIDWTTHLLANVIHPFTTFEEAFLGKEPFKALENSIPPLKIRTFKISRSEVKEYEGSDYEKFLEEEKAKNEELLGNRISTMS